MQAIVSLATKDGNYVKGLARLEESLKHNFDGEFFGFIGEHSVGADKHKYNPYAFKIHAINKVREQGYRQILWLDSSVFAVRDVSSILYTIATRGYIQQEAGCYVGEWTNDHTLKYFDTTRDEAMTMKCYGNAGMLGLNFENETARKFFMLWELSMKHDCFKGEWNNNNRTESQDERCKGHRHDLSAGSIIANQLGMDKHYVAGDKILQYAGPYDAIGNDSIIFKAQGM